MKHLIKEALAGLANLPYSSTKKTVQENKGFNGYPTVEELIEVAQEINIPINKISVTTEECYTLGSYSDICLTWDVEVDKTEKEIAADIKTRFNRGAFKRVYDILIPNGYKRTSSSTSEYKKFDQYNVYDLYYAEEWEILEAYYLLAFKKDEDVNPLTIK